MKIRAASPSDAETISQLAETIWWPSYQGVISDEQIAFMLKDMYAVEKLLQQFERGDSFLLAEQDGEALGFASFALTDASEGVYKLHKLYVLPSEHGKGTGRLLVQAVEEAARKAGGQVLELNVNRKNPAYGFYLRQGFQVHREVDIPYHHFVLNDYVMRKAL